MRSLVRHPVGGGMYIVSALTALPTAGLGGICQPADLLRRPRLDGIVVVVDCRPADLASTARLLCHSMGWSVVDATTADKASWVASARKTSLVIVTGTNARFAMATVKAVRRTSTAPIAVFATLSVGERKTALAAGADVVLPSTIDSVELGHHLEALLRRSSDTWEPRVRYLTSRSLVVDLWARECLLGGTPVHLSPTEYDLLVFLMSHPRRAIAMEKIIQRVWDSLAYRGQINAARIAISRLRSKLVSDESSTGFIRSVRGIGYEFDSPVLEIGDGGQDPNGPDLRNLTLSTVVLEMGAALQSMSFAAASQHCIEAMVKTTGDMAGAIFFVADQRIHLLVEHGNPAQFRRIMQNGVPVRGRSVVHPLDLRQPTQVDEIARLAKVSETVRVMSASGFHRYLYVPLISQGRVWGGIRLASRARRPFDAVVTTFCSAMGAMLSVRLPDPDSLLPAGDGEPERT